MRRFQSLQCTTACPHYGEAVRHNKLCSEECASLAQVCGEWSECGPGQKRGAKSGCTFLDCITALADEFGGGIPYECAAAGDDDCDSPAVVTQSGLWEYDYCFFGDPKRCDARDCVVTESADFGAYYTNNCPCCSRFTDYDGYGLLYDDSECYVGNGGTKRSPDCELYSGTLATAPVCILSNRFPSINFCNELLDKVAFAFDIVSPNQGSGNSCEDVIESKIRSTVQAGEFSPYSVYVSCNYDIDVLKCVGQYEIPRSPKCTANVDVACNIPNEIDCLFSGKDKKIDVL